MSDRFREAFSGAVKRIEERQWIYGLLGRKNSDGSFTFDVPGRRGFLFVTIRNAAGAQTVTPARNDFGVEHRPNLGVRMKLEHGVYVIWGKANRSDLVHTPGSPDYGILPHASTHKNGGSDEIATATPTAHAIPKADESGTLNDWVTAAPDAAELIDDATDLDPPTSTTRFAVIVDSVLRTVTGDNLLGFILDAIDTLYVNISNTQTVTGLKTFIQDIVVGSGAGNIKILLRGGADDERAIRFQSGTVNRWSLVVYFPETGSNAGSNLHIMRHDDGGSELSFSVIGMNRATGNIGINRFPHSLYRLAVTGSLNSDGFLVSKLTGVGATTQTIIPDATGDVTAICRIHFTLSSSAGNKVSDTFELVQSGTMTFDIVAGASTWTVTLASSGQLSVARTAGTATATIQFLVLWI